MASVIERLGEWLERRRLVTWERRCDEACLLTITNVWPYDERPAYGPFVKRSTDALEALGVDSDVLFIRGYRGIRSYLIAAVFVAVLPFGKKYALVHAHGGEAGLVARFYAGTPVVTSYLGSDLLGPQEGGWRLALSRRARSGLLRQHARLMTATTTKTREMAALLPRRVRGRNRVIPDGIQLDHFRPIDRDIAREHLGWSSDAQIALFVGRPDSAIKRSWLAAQAAALAGSELENLELIIASAVDPDDMPYYYSAADCLVHTSASEGSPNVIKEALACNLTIVATPAGDIERLVAGARPGCVVEADVGALAHEVIACCKTPIRSNGRSLTRDMSLETAAAATLELYQSLSDRFAILTQPMFSEVSPAQPRLLQAAQPE